MTFIQENAYLILLHGCSLVEDFNNVRLRGSAAAHSNTKLPAAKYMAVADPAEAPPHLLSEGLDPPLHGVKTSTSKSHRTSFRTLILRVKK